jgi:hypothetical protein
MFKKGKLLSASFAINLFSVVYDLSVFAPPFLSAVVAFEELHLFCRGWPLCLSGYQIAQYLALCYPEDTFLRIKFELTFAHIGKSFCEESNIRCFLLARYHDVIDVREYVSANLIL